MDEYIALNDQFLAVISFKILQLEEKRKGLRFYQLKEFSRIYHQLMYLHSLSIALLDLDIIHCKVAIEYEEKLKNKT